MRNPLARIPSSLGIPGFLGVVAVMALMANYLGGDYFKRTFLDEADPLAGIVAASTHTPGTTPSPAATGPAGASPSPSAPAGSTPVAAVTPTPAAGATQTAAGPALLAEGTFRDGDPGHNGEGIARLIRDADGNHVLRFENFSVTNGPDLFVILSRADGYSGDGALDLGRLKATDGNVNYAIPAGADISQFKSVVIWCRQFSVTFAVATFGGQ